MTRPRFQRKHDRMTYGGVPKAHIAVDHTVAPFDRVAREMDRNRNWGRHRLRAGALEIANAGQAGDLKK